MLKVGQRVISNSRYAKFRRDKGGKPLTGVILAIRENGNVVIMWDQRKIKKTVPPDCVDRLPKK